MDYPERVVAFLDILGFSKMVRSIGENFALHRDLRHALNWFHWMKESSIAPVTTQTSLEVSVFSDCVVISGEHEQLHSVIWSCLNLQAELLGIGILLRGGIAGGRLVHEGNLVYGEGLLRAYELEHKVAVYPRVVIEESLVSDVPGAYRSDFLLQDCDGLWFLDPFSIGIGGVGDAEDLAADGHDPHWLALEQLGAKILQSMDSLTDEAHRVKWGWIKRRYDIAVEEYRQNGSPRYWSKFSTAK